MNAAARQRIAAFLAQPVLSRLFAALTLIAVAGVALFAATVFLSKLALARWHESELPRDA